MSCRDVAYRISSEETAADGLVRRFLTRLHLLYCRHCRRYARQVRVIGQVAKDTLGDRSLDDDRVAELEERILSKAFGAGGDGGRTADG